MMFFEFCQFVCCGVFCGLIVGYCGLFVQVNLVILFDVYVYDFLCFCQVNLKVCLLLGVGELGVFWIVVFGEDFDICIDVLSYNVYRDGWLIECVELFEVLW